MYRLTCRKCNQPMDADSVSQLAGLYLLHCVKSHWEGLVMMHDASNDDIVQATALAVVKGWI